MNGRKARIVVGTVCAVVAIPTVLAFTQEWLPKAAAPVVLLAAAGLIVLYLAWSLVDIVGAMFLRLTRGVTGIASDRSRRDQFSQPWDRARTSIWSWGVGMTSLSRDLEVIRAAVQRDVHVTFEILDAEWLRQNPDIARMVDRTYGRAGFITQIEDSTTKLVLLARELNRLHGADSVKVFAVQEFIAQSATIADPETERAWGWLEYHTFGFPHGQLRIRMRTYRHRSKLNPPLLSHIISSRLSVPRRRMDTTVSDEETGPSTRTATQE